MEDKKKIEARNREQADARRQQKEKSHAREIARLASPTVHYVMVQPPKLEVEPKQLADVKLTTKDKGDDKDRKEVTVQGVVQPGTNGQDVRIDLRGSNGTRGTVIVTTGTRGTFGTRFVIDELEWTKDRKGPQARVRYEVQAHIINASELAPTSSNVVRIG